MAEKCIFDEEKDCDNCLECEMCDLDPNKLCDNCGACLGELKDYYSLCIDKVVSEEEFEREDAGKRR